MNTAWAIATGEGSDRFLGRGWFSDGWQGPQCVKPYSIALFTTRREARVAAKQCRNAEYGFPKARAQKVCVIVKSVLESDPQGRR